MRKRIIVNMEDILHEIKSHHIWELAPFFPEIDFFSIKKRGMKYYYILCPVHKEKNPSCCYSPDAGLFHCFVCGNFSGDIISFYGLLKNKEFFASVIRLAKFFRIKIVWKTVQKNKIEIKESAKNKGDVVSSHSSSNEEIPF